MAEEPETRPTRVDASAEPPADPIGATPTIDIPSAARLFRNGQAVGRYTILELLGKGGMGQVYRAYDPKLRREVAIKVLSDRGGDTEMARLLREAQAMAQLSHPNVVPVYDVEEHEGRIFLAMELIEGETLRVWLRAERSVSEILRVMAQAGRGLAAAHAVDLVHRDFKPANVMVGRDGRARVMDFGIARGTSEIDQDPGETAREASSVLEQSSPSLSAPLTQAGAILGTPAYMAPEQHRGERADHRSDQYSFCIVLYQAISGARPFAARDPAALYKAKLKADPKPLDRSPRHVQAAVRRGLSADPAARFDTMERLLAELERRPGSGARRAAGVAVVAALGVGGWAWTSIRDSRHASACAAEGASIEDTWNPARRRQVEDGLGTGSLPYQDTTRASTLSWLDRYAESWATATEQGCVREGLEGSWSAQTRTRAQWCLDTRRLEFDALITRLESPTAQDIETAVERSAALTPIEGCADERTLVLLEVPGLDIRDAVHETLEKVYKAKALIAAERTDSGLALARIAAVEATDLGFEPLQARAELAIADALDASEDFVAGTKARKDAYFLAMSAGATNIAGAAATSLVFAVGVNQAEESAAHDWFRHARIAHQAAGAQDGDLPLASADFNLGSVEFHAAKVADAKPRFESALAAREEALGSAHPLVAEALNMLASTHGRLGEHELARPLFERALAIQRDAYGNEHPAVAMTLHNIATGLHVQGKFAEAEEAYAESLAIRERALRPDHPDIGLSLNNLAGIAWERNDKQKSLELSQRALAIWESQYGADHPRVANSLTGVAGTHIELKQPGEALPLLRRAVAIYDEHPRGARSNEPTARLELARVLIERGAPQDLEEARIQAAKARALYRELGDDGRGRAVEAEELLAKTAPPSGPVEKK